MIVWLASYPRSGNTALRAILHRAFGIKTYSLYDDKGDIGARSKLTEAVGHASHDQTQAEFYACAAGAEATFVVKTHDAPLDDAKAIYIVRDGRAAIVSFFHYLKDFWPEHYKTLLLKDVVLGNCPFGSWSEHFSAWSPQTRRNTLLVNFNDIVQNPLQVAKTVGTFIGRDDRLSDLPTSWRISVRSTMYSPVRVSIETSEQAAP